ncbi:MAG: tRNA (adenosine(37)-N6)-threonylcarbamoyltransferase complex ATPase subunit type 1 TsaE [Propionibacteriaceae bacterium]|jgi:tRNA threonylcarbamoyladenosine biosynthesis protein TsaE|nr:tRNA (adenosine(37)-N6)-threonylcarbamoyltransferase complex ATPase subunit type 1 TsaE [Propionibacteriaceae bacterium]
MTPMTETTSDRAFPEIRLETATAESTHALGRRLAQVTRAGDLIILTGSLGAGKTVLAQGIGQGLGVTGPIISPTFVLVRIHPSAGSGPGLVHVDAYRLTSRDEVDDLDLDSLMVGNVAVVEWGSGVADHLAEDRLEITLDRSADPLDETRVITIVPVGERWAGVDWSKTLGQEEQEWA